jgi:FkbM family methyltransferase
MMRKQYPIIVKMRYGNSVTCDNYLDVYNTAMGLELDAYENIVSVNGLKFYGGKHVMDISATFVQEDYKFLPVRDKVVVDIGAGLADSSIYFCTHGARKVLAIEPDTSRFELAERNIKTNNFCDRIVLIHAGCVGMNGENYDIKQDRIVPLKEIITKSGGFLTLEQIINKLDQSPDILKLACLGCEYDVLLNSPNEVITQFSHIQVQYVFGYRNIKEKLENCGFQVTSSGPIHIKYTLKPLDSKKNKKQIINMHYGYIYAARK